MARAACREVVDARRAKGELAGAIETARRWVAPDSLDDEVQHDRLGNSQEAARHYARFVELWRESDPQFQPVIDAARQRLAELTRAAGS